MMKPEFKRCLEKGKIIVFKKGPSLVPKEMDSATEDLVSSKDSLKRKNYKWATIQAYYCMFHTARALIYAQKYREKSHYCLVIALEHLYVGKGLIERGLVESLIMGKDMRESADYRSSFSKEGADNLVTAAENFLANAKELLKKT